MNILFITAAWPAAGETNLYTDLMAEFALNGHKVTVVALGAPTGSEKTGLANENSLRVLHVRTGKLRQSGKYRKTLSAFAAGPKIYAAVRRYLKRERFELLLLSTPPITLTPCVVWLKRKYRMPLYLLLKDIWPDDAADLGAMKRGGVVWRVFRLLEKYTYRCADVIGCMSEASARYVLSHNADLSCQKVEVCPNSRCGRHEASDNRDAVRAEYGIPAGKTVFLYGGNLGKAQGVDFLIRAARVFRNDTSVFFLIVGSGTEYGFLNNGLAALDSDNVLLLPALPTADYERLAAACDVGLVLLHPSGAVPNFPSRMLSYLMAGLPVIAATNAASDVGELLERYGCGFGCINGDLCCFRQAVSVLLDDAMRTRMGEKAKVLFNTRYTSSQSYERIIRHFQPSNKA